VPAGKAAGGAVFEEGWELLHVEDRVHAVAACAAGAWRARAALLRWPQYARLYAGRGASARGLPACAGAPRRADWARCAAPRSARRQLLRAGLLCRGAASAVAPSRLALTRAVQGKANLCGRWPGPLCTVDAQHALGKSRGVPLGGGWAAWVAGQELTPPARPPPGEWGSSANSLP
jgi:hypothetical protein